MNILVTGSNGIIGQQVLFKILDRYPTARVYLLNRRLLAGYDSEKVSYIGLDLLAASSSELRNVLEQIKPDLLFHCAWDTGHKDYLTNPDNLKWEHASKNLIDIFYVVGGKRFIGIGSSIEYDWKSGSIFDEINSSMDENGWLYGKSKLNVFLHLQALKKSYLWCRVFFVFGPGQDKTRLVPVLINNALDGGGELNVNLNMKRDYISTFEIANQIIMMTETEYCGAVNICSGSAIGLGQLVKIIERSTNLKIQLSATAYVDNFENDSIEGGTEIIHQYYPNYSYSNDKLIADLEKTIISFKS